MLVRRISTPFCSLLTRCCTRATTLPSSPSSLLSSSFHSSHFLLSDKKDTPNNPTPLSDHSTPSPTTSSPSSSSSLKTKAASTPSSPKSTLPSKSKKPKVEEPIKQFEIEEKDLEEKFILGNGPGGQHVNKTSNTVFLKHIPTGVFVKCNQTRSREQNRKLARTILKDKLDLILNGKNSKIEQQREKIRKQKAKRKRRGFGNASNNDVEGQE